VRKLPLQHGDAAVSVCRGTYIHRRRLIPDCIILRPTVHRRRISVENTARHGTASPPALRPPATSSIHRRLSGGRGFFEAGGPAGISPAPAHRPPPPGQRSSPAGAISYRRHGNRLAGQTPRSQHLRVTEIRCPDVQSDHARPRRAVRSDAGTSTWPDPVPCRL